MITIFHFIAFLGAIIGFAGGGVISGKFFGMIGGIVGVLLGAYIGLILGRLPGFFSTRLLIRDVRWKTTTELQAILQVNQFYFFQLAIAELAVRGEDIQKERSYVLELLVSDNYAARVCAWQTLRYFFPDAAKQIVEYQPKDSLDICRIKTRGLAEMT